MSVRSKDYSGISVAWLLGDEGSLSDYNQLKPSPPQYFHPQLARLFLEYIQIGLTDRQACIEVPMNEKWPRTWSRGAMSSPLNFTEALDKYAKPLQYDMMAKDVVDISDGTDALSNENAVVESVYNPLREALSKSRKRNLKMYRSMVGDRISARKWYVGKMRPKIYGDKVQLDHGNAHDKPLRVIDYSKLTIKQLEALAKLDASLADKDGNK